MQNDSFKREHSLDFIKFVFTLIIIWHHFQNRINVRIIDSGYLCVEMFFIISGFFLYRNYKLHKYSDAGDFTIKRIKKIYPIYIIGLILTFVTYKLDIRKMPVFFIESILMQGTGLFKDSVNYPCWYVSVLIIGGYFIYKLLENDENKYTKLIAPLIVIFTYTFLQGKVENWNSFLFFYVPLWRGIADMSVGVCISAFSDSMYFLKIKNFFHSNRMSLFIMELAIYLLSILMIIKRNEQELLIVILFAFIVLFTQIDFSIINKISNKLVFSKINIISYPMYILHASFIRVVDRFFIKTSIISSNFLIIVLLYGSLAIAAIIMNQLSRKIYKKV